MQRSSAHIHSNHLLSKNDCLVIVFFSIFIVIVYMGRKLTKSQILFIKIYIFILYWLGFVWHWCLFSSVFIMKREKNEQILNDRAVLSILRYIAVLSSWIYESKSSDINKHFSCPCAIFLNLFGLKSINIYWDNNKIHLNRQMKPNVTILPCTSKF